MKKVINLLCALISATYELDTMEVSAQPLENSATHIIFIN